MSRVRELAKAEAAKAEQQPAPAPDAPAPEPEPTPAPEPEPAPAPEPEPAPAPEAAPPPAASVEQQQKIFDRAMRDFHAKLAALFEVDELEPSQTPGVAGFVMPGFVEKRTHPDFTRCTTCNGHGKVLTQSLKPPDDEHDCPDLRCKGRGYWQRPAAPPPPPLPFTAPTPAQSNGSDEWGEAPAWMGDPRLTNP